MADIRGYDAEAYLQFIQGVDDTTPFPVSNEEPGKTPDFPNTPRGRLSFNDLADGDTITYRAESAGTAKYGEIGTPKAWEVGIGTYVAADKTLTRAVLASSNSDAAVDFSVGGTVCLEGHRVISEAWAVTNLQIDRAFDADTALVAEVANALGTLIVDLQSEGILPDATTSP